MRKAKDFQPCPVSAARYAKLYQVVSGVRSSTRSYLLLDLGFRIFINTAWIILVTTLGFVQTALAQPYHAHTDVEFRLGGGVLNGTDTDNEEGVPRTIKMTAQIFADRLFPVTTIGNFIAPQPFQAGRVVRKSRMKSMSVYCDSEDAARTGLFLFTDAMIHSPLLGDISPIPSSGVRGLCRGWPRRCCGRRERRVGAGRDCGAGNNW